MATATNSLYASSNTTLHTGLFASPVPSHRAVQPPESTRGMNAIGWSLLVAKVILGAVFVGLAGSRGELEPVPVREPTGRR